MIRSVINESIDGMMNPLHAYYDAGYKCGHAVSKNNRPTAAAMHNWLSKALALEKGGNKAKAEAEFNRGYEDGNPKPSVKYFSEQQTDADRLYAVYDYTDGGPEEPSLHGVYLDRKKAHDEAKWIRKAHREDPLHRWPLLDDEAAKVKIANPETVALAKAYGRFYAEPFNAINETGEWNDGDDNLVAWKKQLENDIKHIENATDGKLKLKSIHGFDAYQGPYAWVSINNKPYKIWTDSSMLWIEGFPVDNTSDQGKFPGFLGYVDDIVEMLDDESKLFQYNGSFSMNESHPPVKGGEKPMRWGNGDIASLNDRLENGKAIGKFISKENAIGYSRTKWNKLGWDEQRKYAEQMNRQVTKYNVMFDDESFVSVPRNVYEQIKLQELPEKNFWQKFTA